MDNKAVKDLLKSANKLVLGKKYEETLESCKEILALDERSYMARVFMGAAQEGLTKYADAMRSYKEAVRIDSNQVLAWQGLGKLYDRAEDALRRSNEDFFVEVFEKLREVLKNDDDRRLANEVRLCKLHSLRGRSDLSLEVINSASTSHRGKFYSALFDVDATEIVLPDEPKMLETLMQAGKEVSKCSTEKEGMRDLAWKTYILCLMKLGKSTDELWEVALNECHSPCNSFRNELLLRIYLDTYPERSKELSGSEVVEHLDQRNTFRNLYEGLQLNMQGCQKEAKVKFDEVIRENKSLPSAYRFQSGCLQKLHMYRDSINSAREGLKLLDLGDLCFYGDRQQIRDEFRLFVAKNSFQLKDETAFKEANEIILQLQAMKSELNKTEILSLRFLTSIKSGNKDDMEQLSELARSQLDEMGISSDNISNLNLCLGQAAMKVKDFKMAQSCFERSSQVKGDDPRPYLFLGLAHWEALKNDRDDENAEEKKKLFIESMKKAIQLDASDPQPYFHIGCYLSKTPGAEERAKQFLMKSFDLDLNEDDDIAVELVNHLIKIKDQENAVMYLNKILQRQKAECPKWVLLRLGAYHLQHGDISEAISHIQSAVRKDVKDMKSWERLGEAYLQRGSYTSALKAFTKVVDHDTTSLYSLYQIACIHQKLGLLKEAVEKFREVINMSPDYTPALFGLGESNLQLAVSYISRCLYGRAVVSLRETLDCLSRATDLHPEHSSLWNCLGDSFTTFYKIPDCKMSEVLVPEFTKFKKLLSSSSLSPSSFKHTLLIIGEKCYLVALNLRPEASNLWYNVGINNHYQTKVLLGQAKGEGSLAIRSKDINSVASTSSRCLQRALSLDSTNHDCWNSLGVVALSKPIVNYAIAQHSFIMSIKQHNNNVTAWANLGFLYLMNKNAELAHLAFQNAQSIEPLFISSWIGQALVAEKVMSSGDVHQLEAMDLFRHSIEIDNHPEAAVSYAHWVCSTMDEFSRMSNSKKDNKNNWLEFTFKHLNAINTALDAMAKYTATRPDDIRGWNYYGLLCEKQNLFRVATEAFERCFKLLDDRHEDASQRRVVLTNYARLLCKVGNYELALEHYNDLYELLSTHFEDDTSPVDICLMALCYYKNKQYEQSFETYDSALEINGEDEDPRVVDLIYIAMGTNLFLQDKFDDAKHFLFKGIRSQGGAADEVLCSLLCVGLMQKDLTLVNAVLNEIHNLGGRSLASSSPHLAFLSSRAKFLLSKSKEAYGSCRNFLRHIHLRPDQSESWVRAAMFLLDGDVNSDVTNSVKVLCEAALSKDDKTLCEEALQCLAIVSLRSSPFTQTPSPLPSPPTPPPSPTTPTPTLQSSMTPPVARKTLVSSFSLAQKLVRLYPDRLANWCILLAGCQQQLVARQVVSNDNNGSEELKSFVLATSKRVMAQVESASIHDRENPHLKDMHKWLSRQHAIALINMGQIQEAKSFLETVGWLYDNDRLFTALAAFLDNDVDQLVSNNEEDEENFSKLLTALLVSGRMRRERRELFANHVEASKWFAESMELKSMIEAVIS